MTYYTSYQEAMEAALNRQIQEACEDKEEFVENTEETYEMRLLKLEEEEAKKKNKK